MAKILFGPSSMRINIDKAWRHLNKPEVIHGDIEERKAFIYKVKKELGVDDFLRRSSRKMAHGPLRYWDYPVWVIQPKRPIIAANPNHFPLEIHSSKFGIYDKDDIEAMYSDKLMEEQENIFEKYEGTNMLNIDKSMKKIVKGFKKTFRKHVFDDDEENKEQNIEAKAEEIKEGKEENVKKEENEEKVKEEEEEQEVEIDFNDCDIDFIQTEEISEPDDEIEEEGEEEVEHLDKKD